MSLAEITLHPIGFVPITCAELGTTHFAEPLKSMVSEQSTPEMPRPLLGTTFGTEKPAAGGFFVGRSPGQAAPSGAS